MRLGTEATRQPVVALSGHLQKLFVWWTGWRSFFFFFNYFFMVWGSHQNMDLRPLRETLIREWTSRYWIAASEVKTALLPENPSIWILLIELPAVAQTSSLGGGTGALSLMRQRRGKVGEHSSFFCCRNLWRGGGDKWGRPPCWFVHMSICPRATAANSVDFAGSTNLSGTFWVELRVIYGLLPNLKKQRWTQYKP